MKKCKLLHVHTAVQQLCQQFKNALIIHEHVSLSHDANRSHV